MSFRKLMFLMLTVVLPASAVSIASLVPAVAGNPCHGARALGGGELTSSLHFPIAVRADTIPLRLAPGQRVLTRPFP
jgi:hypothetical protein